VGDNEQVQVGEVAAVRGVVWVGSSRSACGRRRRVREVIDGGGGTSDR
jgi:hypothetical protein